MIGAQRIEDAALQRGRACFEAGMAALDAEDFLAAAAAFETGLACVPGRPSLLANLALARWHLGQPDFAARHARDALAGDPTDLSAAMTLVQCLLLLNEFESALQVCEHTLVQHPQAAIAWCNRGQTHHALRLDAQALADFAHAVQLDPALAVAWSNLGLLLGRAGDGAAALASLEQALVLAPGYADAWVNLAEVRDRLGDIDGALFACDQALLHAPQLSAARLNRAKLLADLGRSAEALAGFEALLRDTPDQSEARWNLALLRLEMGDYAAGWGDYEARWQLPDHEAARHAQLPQLPSLAAARNARVLVCCEQGLGDVLQFCRYVPLLRAHAHAVVFEVPESMTELLASLDPEVTLLPLGSPPDRVADCQWRVPLLSLPGLFGTPLDNVPAAPAYLRAPTDRIERWRTRLGPATPGRPRIALACSGNPRHPQDRHRSAALAYFAPLAQVAELILVQRDLAADDATQLQALGIRWIGPALRDFADTAAVLALCVRVISVDTSILHLAGALGCPAWGLLAEPFDWRWLRGRDDSPWYPGVRLFRQQHRGDWTDVLARVAEALNSA